MMDSNEIARLLEEYSSEPPKKSLTAEEIKHLSHFVKKDRTFRKLKDLVRITAWEQMVFALNTHPGSEDFVVEFAMAQGKRDGMLKALEMLEDFLEESEGHENE